jgi:hypothetical protein
MILALGVKGLSLALRSAESRAMSGKLQVRDFYYLF